MTTGTVTALPVPENERYESRQQLADRLGVHVSTVDRFVSEGMPSETWGLRARRFRPSVALAWMRERGHQTKDQAA